MVKTVGLFVTDGYVLPASIASLTPSSTVMYLDCIDGLLTEYASTINELEVSTLTSALELKYHKLESNLTIKNKDLMRASTAKHINVVTSYDARIKELQDTVDRAEETIQIEINKAKVQFAKELAVCNEAHNRTTALDREFVDHAQKLKSQMIISELNIQTEKNTKLQVELRSAVEEKDAMTISYRARLDQERIQITDSITEQVKLSATRQLKSDLAVAHNTIEHLKEQTKEHQLAMCNTNELYKSLVSDKAYVSLGIASTDKTVKDLSDQIQPIINMYTGSNEEKGLAGEQTVMNILMEPKYESAKVFDTSGESACGDIHFHWNDLRCLIEVKNKKTITLEDMKKFERDVRNCKESTKNINCAIFVSLCSNQYPGRSMETIQLDTINNVPVIYTYVANLDMLHYSIMCLNKLVKNTNTDSHTMETLMSYYNGYVKHVSKSITYFSKLIKSHETNIKSLKKEINQLTILDDDLSSNVEFYQVQENMNLLNTNGDESDESDDSIINTETTESLDLSVTKLDASVDRVVDYYISNSLTRKRNPSIHDMIKHFNITTNTLLKKLGGIKSISTKAKNKYMTNSVSNDVVRRLKLYKIANGCYPKRVELVRDYISHRQLVKIGYVFKSKKIMDAVYAHVESAESVDVETDVEIETTESTDGEEIEYVYETDEDS